MAEAQQEHGEPPTRLVFRMTKILIIARTSVKVFTRHYTRCQNRGPQNPFSATC
jgi:hypothetical protein